MFEGKAVNALSVLEASAAAEGIWSWGGPGRGSFALFQMLNHQPA